MTIQDSRKWLETQPSEKNFLHLLDLFNNPKKENLNEFFNLLTLDVWHSLSSPEITLLFLLAKKCFKLNQLTMLNQFKANRPSDHFYEFMTAIMSTFEQKNSHRNVDIFSHLAKQDSDVEFSKLCFLFEMVAGSIENDKPTAQGFLCGAVSYFFDTYNLAYAQLIVVILIDVFDNTLARDEFVEELSNHLNDDGSYGTVNPLLENRVGNLQMKQWRVKTTFLVLAWKEVYLKNNL